MNAVSGADVGAVVDGESVTAAAAAVSAPRAAIDPKATPPKDETRANRVKRRNRASLAKGAVAAMGVAIRQRWPEHARAAQVQQR